HSSSTHVTTIANHRTFDSFGNITAEANSAVDTLFAFTGAQRDDETGLQYQRERYLDLTTGGWVSEDPIGFDGDPSNLNRYAGNSVTILLDPSGLHPPGSMTLGGRHLNDEPPRDIPTGFLCEV